MLNISIVENSSSFYSVQLSDVVRTHSFRDKTKTRKKGLSDPPPSLDQTLRVGLFYMFTSKLVQTKLRCQRVKFINFPLYHHSRTRCLEYSKYSEGGISEVDSFSKKLLNTLPIPTSTSSTFKFLPEMKPQRTAI